MNVKQKSSRQASELSYAGGFGESGLEVRNNRITCWGFDALGSDSFIVEPTR